MHFNFFVVIMQGRLPSFAEKVKAGERYNFRVLSVFGKYLYLDEEMLCGLMLCVILLCIKEYNYTLKGISIPPKCIIIPKEVY